MKDTEKQELINDMLGQVERKENDFPIIDEKGEVLFPVLNRSGIRIDWEKPTYTVSRFARGGGLERIKLPKGLKGYNGLCLEVNDHGNVTVWKCYRNGKRKEIASCV